MAVFFLDWFLSLFGLGAKNPNILFTGLDNAGKTTLLFMLKSTLLTMNQGAYTPSNQKGDIEVEAFGGRINYVQYDLGGMPNCRRRGWCDQFTQPGPVKGVIFMVDAGDPTRIPEVKIELHKLLNSLELSTVPFLILLNKTDLSNAINEDEMRVSLGLEDIVRDKEVVDITEPELSLHRPVEIFSCSIVKRKGFIEGLKWLAQYVKR